MTETGLNLNSTETETGLNLNSTVAVLIWAVGDCSSLGCILWASLPPIETKSSLQSSVTCFLFFTLRANLFNFNAFMSCTDSTFEYFQCIFVLVLFNLASIIVFSENI